MKKFILLLTIIGFTAGNSFAQDYMRGCGSVTGWCDIPNVGGNQTVNICGTGGSDQFLAPIWVLAPLTTPTFTMFYKPLYGGFYTQVIPNVAGSPITYTTNQRIITVQYHQAGMFAIRADYTPNVASDERFMEIFVSDNTAAKNPSAFTLTNVNNCPSPSTAFTIVRANQSNEITQYYLDITQCNASGVITTNGQYWRQNDNNTASAGWQPGRMSAFTPSLPANFFVGNRYYKIKLAVSNACSGWIDSTQILYIKSGLATPTFTVSQTDAVPITNIAGVFDAYTCLNTPIQLTNTTPAVSCGTTTSTATNVKITCYHTPSQADGNCVSGTSIGYDEKTLPFQGSYDLRTVFNSTDPAKNCNMGVAGNYLVRMQVQTAFGWSNSSSAQCIRVNSNGLESAEFLQCQKLPPAVPNITNCRNALVTTAPRCSTISCAVIAGPSSAGIKLPPSVPSGVDSIRVSVFRMVPGTVPSLMGSQTYPIGGNLGQMVLFKNMILGDNNLPADYDYFKRDIAFAATQTYRVTQKVHNACGWTADSQTPIGYFKITAACKDYYADFRLANNGDNIEEIQEMDILDINNTISVYPNPTTGTVALIANNDYATARLDIIDVTGKIVQTPFVEERIFAGSVIELNITDFTTGIYFYRLTSADGVLTGKIIKQ
jgi:Secretion system C-terminal sorting domain